MSDRKKGGGKALGSLHRLAPACTHAPPASLHSPSVCQPLGCLASCPLKTEEKAGTEAKGDFLFSIVQCYGDIRLHLKPV